MSYIGRIGAISVVLLLSTYYAVSYFLEYGELTIFEFSGDVVYLVLAWWGGKHFDKARVLTKVLQRKQQELESIFKNGVDAVVIWDLEGRIQEVNPAYEKMTGYTKEEVVGKIVPFIKGEEDVAQQLISDLLKNGEIPNFEVVREKKNYERIICSISLSLLQDKKGNPERILVIWRDITEQKKDERAIKESEERYRTLIEFSPDTILVHSSDEILFINKAGLELLGANHEEELLGKSIYDLVDQTYWEVVKGRIKEAHETKSVSAILEERIIGVDGRVIYGEVATMPIMYMGKQANQVIVRDITEKKRIEQELRKHDRQLRKIMDNMSDILTQTNEKLELEYVNPATVKMLGYEATELLGTSILELIHPDNREDFHKGIQKITNQNSRVRIEFQSKHFNNYYLWLESLVSALFDKDTGEIKGYVIISRNITDRKANEELIHKQDRLLQGVSKATNMLLTIPEYKMAINRTIAMLARVVNAERVFIFENMEKKDPTINLRFEWVNELLEPQLNNSLLQNFSYKRNGFKRWYDELSSGGRINNAVKDCPKDEQEVLEKMDIHSVLCVPILIHNAYWGFICFGDCTRSRKWSKNEEMIMLVAASGIGGAIERKQKEKELQEALVEKEISEQKLKETNEILKRYSSIDGLTEIPNRRYFDQFLDQEWEKAVSSNYSISLVMLDIDFFKKYNDTYGHQGGDDCLKRIAAELDANVTKSGAIAARYGGEEFVVVLPETEQDEAKVIAESIRASIEGLGIPHIASDIADMVTISVGVSTCIPIVTENQKDLIQKADIALYDAKRLGRNRVCVYQDVKLPH